MRVRRRAHVRAPSRPSHRHISIWIYKSMSKYRKIERDTGRDAVVTVRDGRFIERSGRDTAASRGVRPKTPITMWELLVWTYQRQRPHKAGEGRIGPARSSLSQTAIVLRHAWSCGASSGA